MLMLTQSSVWRKGEKVSEVNLACSKNVEADLLIRAALCHRLSTHQRSYANSCVCKHVYGNNIVGVYRYMYMYRIYCAV